MKTISTLVYLLVIVSICATSAVLYLNQEYNFSALLTITWIISLTVWIKANGLLEEKKEQVIQQVELV
ncbi:MAG: hypothetical protein ABIY90_01500 [Puia sp.]